MKGNGVRNKKNKVAKVKLFQKKKNINTDEVISSLQAAYCKINPKEISKFSDFPFSFKTQKGLKENGFIVPTDIQKESIGHALQGKDILGAAKTGSGKTLAFLIPVLEKLFCNKWTRLDGTGALIITPTRELAYQIFETLRKVGFYHDFSAGLIIGGKDLKFEKKRMDQCNIVICTPGRLLHHMDENPLFDCVNLQLLVLDEADRCLDMGFEETMNSIIENLPSNRQTLLFSATQTKSVRDLARLSLTSPTYISVHENSSYSTPEGLTQSYMICELEDKLAVLWSFIKNHYKHKIIVFLSSCKQVKYIFEIFCQLRPGIALLSLYGSLHQQRRMDIYRSFCNKEHAVLFATDIASRGLDFPAVNWVIQMDCPEDATTYIHRVGRTARYHKGGEALLVLLPSEAEAMLANLKEKKIPINEIKVNQKKLQNPRVKIEAMLARKTELKESAQRAFVSYVKSVFLMKDKNVFNVYELNTDAFARSLGLVVSPRIRFLQRLQKNQIQKVKGNNTSSELLKSTSSNNNIKGKEMKLENVVKSEPETTSDEENNVGSKKNTKAEKLNHLGKNILLNNDNDEKEIKLENVVKSESESISEEDEDIVYKTFVKGKKESHFAMNESSAEVKLEYEIESEPESESSSNEQENDNNSDVCKNNLKKSQKFPMNSEKLESNLKSENRSQFKEFKTFNFGIDVDSDSDDEILKIKRSDHALDDDDDDLMTLDEPGRRRKKHLTKAAVAKRILKKNIVPNKKIVFTEDGEAVEDRFKQRVTELGKKYEENIEGGGISIEEAQRVLREEDKIDKQTFRMRIKEKHKEERIKLKKLRKGEDSDKDDEANNAEGEYFDEYSDNDYSDAVESRNSDVSENSDSEVDGNSDSGSYSERNDDSDSRFVKRGVKRKQDSTKIVSKRFKGEVSSNSLTLDEELALKLLGSRS